MTPFLLTTKTFNQKGLPVFNKKGLKLSQRRFVEGCEKTFRDQRRHSPNARFTVGVAGWFGDNDFVGMMIEADDPDLAIKEFEDIYNNQNSSDLQVGDEFTREQIVELGTEEAGMIYDRLKDGGIWPWVNAGATFRKTGDRLVVESIH